MSQLSNTSLFNHANLVAYYKLETGALTTDSKGSYTLTNQGSIGETTGKYGVAGDPGNPNGDNGLLYRTASIPALTGNFSFSGWFNWYDASGGTLVGWCDTTNDVFIRCGYDGTNIVFYRVKSGVAQQGPTYVFTPTVGRWYHVGMTYDGTNVRGYVDGALVAGPTAASGNGSVNETSGIGLGIDGQAFGALTTTSTIKWDDVGFFTEALTAAEMLEHYTDPPIGGFIYMSN